MPAAVPILISVGLGALSGGLSGGFTVGSIFAGAALGAAVGALGLLTTPKKPKSAREVVDAIQTSAQRNTPVQVIFGRGRTGGNLICYPAGSGAIQWWGTKLDDNGGKAYEGRMIVALCEGPIQDAGNYRQDGLPVFDAYQQLVDQKIDPEFKSGTIDQRRDATFYFNLHNGTTDQVIPPMMLDADTNLAAGRVVMPNGFSIDDGSGGKVLAGSHMPMVPWRNTALVATQNYLGGSYSRIATITADVVGPDLTLLTADSDSEASGQDAAGAVVGYDGYSECFFFTAASSGTVESPLGIFRIGRTNATLRQHTPPPAGVTSDVSIAFYLGRHDIVVMQDPDAGSFWHIGMWGLDRDDDLWETFQPSLGQVFGGYDNEILGHHLDEYHGILHTLHDDSSIRYVIRWNLLTGRVERFDTDLASATFTAFMYSPDIHAYIVTTDAGDIFAVGAESGVTSATASTSSSLDISDVIGLYVSGNRVGIVKTNGVQHWDATEPDKTFDPLGGSGTDLSTGNFGGTVHAVQNTWTGHVALIKPDGDTVGLINFIPSVLEDIEDVSAMGTPGQVEFQTLFGASTKVLGDTFSWNTGACEEPFFRKVDPPTSVYTRTSPNCTIDIPTGAETLSFGTGSHLDDILILIKQSESVTDDWDGTSERPTVNFTIPTDAFVIANTSGSYMSEEDVNFFATCPKNFSDGSNELDLPDGSLDPSTDDSYHALIDAGFNVHLFADGIPLSDLISAGFVDSGQLKCKLVHIVCGTGDAVVDEMGFISSAIPSDDPDTVAGWTRDWSYRQHNAWRLVQLQGRSSLAAALWNVLVLESRSDTSRWGAGQSPDFFSISSFEHLHSRCVAGWKYANNLKVDLAGSGTIGSASAVSSASGAILGAVTFHQFYRYAERYKLDLVLDTQTGVSDLITSQILACCNGYRLMIGEKLHVGIPLPGAFPIWHFQDDVIKDGTAKVSFVGRTNILNRVRVQYREVRDESRINIVQADQEFAQNQYGRVTEQTLTLNGIARGPQATLIANAVLNEAIAQRLGIEYQTSYLGYAVIPGDVVELSYRGTPLNRTKSRLVDIQEGNERTVTINATQQIPVLGALGAPAAGLAPVGSLGSDVGSDEVPGECEEQTGSTGSGVRWFNGGANYAAGCYDIFYLTNCYKLTATGGYAVAGYDVVTRDSDNNLVILMPAPAVPNLPDGWTTQEAAVAANAGESGQFELATAGPIGLVLKHPPAFTNFADLGPAPSYQLCVCDAVLPSNSDPELYRQARKPTDSKPGALQDVWLPVDSIPPGPVDFNFVNEEDGLCYYIHYADPSSPSPGHVISAFTVVSISNSNVSCTPISCDDPSSQPGTLQVEVTGTAPDAPDDVGIYTLTLVSPGFYHYFNDETGLQIDIGCSILGNSEGDGIGENLWYLGYRASISADSHGHAEAIGTYTLDVGTYALGANFVVSR